MCFLVVECLDCWWCINVCFVCCVWFNFLFVFCSSVSTYCWVPTYKTFDNGNRLGWGFRFYQWLTRFVLLFIIWLLISGIKVKTSSVTFVVSWLQVVIQVAGNKEFGRPVVSVYQSTVYRVPMYAPHNCTGSILFS